ncbi:MAG: DnaD domain protein [Lachnospiraceae bacterium]|nr:DnaD domain protein [Lachnospiraceae bacterium]
MGFLTIYQDNYTDSTVISNRFIDEYMQSANDAQLKIYLYLIRMMSARLGTSISDIADKFNYTEKDVVGAVKYWENNRLLTVDCDEHKNITGIHLLDSNAGTDMLSITAGAAAASMATYPSAAASMVTYPSTAAAVSTPTYPSTAAVLPPQPDGAVKPVFEKPNYTAEQLRSFKTNEDTARLLFVAEQYLKKPLSAGDVRTIFFIMDRLGFSEDLTDYLLQYCVDRGKRDFRYIEKVAISWAEQGIATPKQAAALAGKYDRSFYEIMRALGKSSVPTDTEASYIERWQKTYGFEMDVILDACERTVLATDSHRFEYAESILKRWYGIGVHHKNDIKALDADHRRTKTGRRQMSANKFNQFAQNNYDFDALEQEILSN